MFSKFHVFTYPSDVYIICLCIFQVPCFTFKILIVFLVNRVLLLVSFGYRVLSWFFVFVVVCLASMCLILYFQNGCKIGVLGIILVLILSIIAHYLVIDNFLIFGYSSILLLGLISFLIIFNVLLMDTFNSLFHDYLVFIFLVLLVYFVGGLFCFLKCIYFYF